MDEQFSAVHILFLVAGLVAGGVGTWLVFRNKLAIAETNGRAAGEIERTALSEQLKAAANEKSRLEACVAESEARINKLQTELDGANQTSAKLTERARRLSELEQAYQELSNTRDALFRDQADYKAKIAELTTTLDKERAQMQEKLGLLNEAREQLTNQFKALANEILDEKSKKFTEQNQTNLGQLLNPLQERIKEFQAKVEEVYVNEGKDRSALAEQVKLLTQLNNTLSQDTQNLTLALKGDRKAQGGFGEIILDDVLEKAGLVRGQHYERQNSVKSEDGQSYVIPDVVVRLPGDRHLVIDSKMTLPDYRAYVSADDEGERAAALKRHLSSTRTHIKVLSEKNYQALYGLKSLDFVVMFIPLEPAFMLAVTNDRELFHQGWEKNVLLVSPSTLLFVIRTVANLWRQEDLSKNAKEISSRGAELYDKFVGFVTDLQEVGKRIEQAQASYNEARRKFSEGSGNVIRQAEMLKKLGVKPSKTLPAQWVEPALDNASVLTAEANDKNVTSD